MMGHPPQQINTMGGEGRHGMSEPFLADSVLLSQKTSECCKCCCCQPNIHWQLFQDDNNPNANAPRIPIASISEDAPYVGRCCSFCMPGSRETKYAVRRGNYDENSSDPNAPVMFTIQKPRTFGSNIFILAGEGGQLRLPCCCNLPFLEAKGPDGSLWGRTEYMSCLANGQPFISKYQVLDGQGRVLYAISPDVCAGCCPQVKCGGQGRNCCKIPFYIRDPTTNEKVVDSQVCDLWVGLKREACTRRNMYQIKYPPRVDEKIKATLLGSALLIDMCEFEQNDS